MPLSLIRRLRLACLLLLTVAALVPAFEAHACMDTDCAPAAVAADPATDDPSQPCADCGQVCAEGCCHAPHVATVPDLSMVQDVPAFAAPLSWSHSAVPPLPDAAGPRRPPRI